MNLRDLKLRLRALLGPGRVDSELDDELAFHIECETRKHVANGLAPAEARARARARFGSPALVADECRDTRGTAFVDGTVRDILYAFRAFRRAPLAALTIVATVALGLGLVTVVFTLYSAFYLRVDDVHDPSALFEVKRVPAAGAKVWMPFTRRELDALVRETDVLSDASGALDVITTRVDGRAATGSLVTGNYFNVLGVTAALGRVLAPADDDVPGAPVIVLSHKGWSKLAGRDPAIVGKPVSINGEPFGVIGVMPEGFGGFDIASPDYWAPIALASQLRRTRAGRADDVLDTVVGRLRPAVSAQTATAALTAWVSAAPERQTRQFNRTAIWLNPLEPTFTAMLEGLKIFGPIFVAFGLILLIACANVANLLLARGMARQREIGVRLSLGASRARIIRQLLTESALLALASAACAFAISRLLLEAAVRVAMTTLPPEVAELASLSVPGADWTVLVFLVAGAMAATMFFGLAPAVQATRLELVRAMRGELTRDARPYRARQILIAGQVCASALLLVCAGVFLGSTLRAATFDRGVRTSDTVAITIGHPAAQAAVVAAVSADPVVTAVAASSPGPVAIARSAVVEAPGAASNAPSRIGVAYQFVSPPYFDVLGIDVLQGRGFVQAEQRAGAGSAVIANSLARRLWPDGPAVGQALRLVPNRLEGPPGAAQLPPGSLTVVGVVSDIDGGRGLVRFTDPGVYLPLDAGADGASLTLRVRGNPDDARRGLLERLSSIDPTGDVKTIRTMAGIDTYILSTAFWVAVVLGGVALVLTVSGLFSVLSYVVAQRSKEIGVRMALGATPRNIARLVLTEAARPVSLGLVVGCALAALLATAVMSTGAASEISRLVPVTDPVTYAGALLCIATACLGAVLIPARRAARIDPMATLKQD